MRGKEALVKAWALGWEGAPFPLTLTLSPGRGKSPMLLGANPLPMRKMILPLPGERALARIKDFERESYS